MVGTGMSRRVVSDQYGFFDELPEDEQEVLVELRSHLEREVKPLLGDYWERGEFPTQIIAGLAERRLMDPPSLGHEPSDLYHRWRSFEFARVDASIATFYNAVSGLFRTTLTVGGSPEQAARWDPLIREFALTGTFALTEPDHGSDIARGIQTTCRREGDEWVVDGQKRWIGGVSLVQKVIIFAREHGGDDDGAVRAFVADTDDPALTLTKIARKTSLRIMQNFDIDISGLRVHESQRLARISSFTDVNECLRRMRVDVSWIATGVAAGAYEAALKYTMEREQFGAPLAGYQLIQEKLARMLANVTASLSLVVGLQRKQQAGEARDEDSALAKLFTCDRLRETVALAREVCGGNGITLDTDVARFHADAEAIYSYEGTHEINALIVGRAATGIGAFVTRLHR